MSRSIVEPGSSAKLHRSVSLRKGRFCFQRLEWIPCRIIAPCASKRAGQDTGDNVVLERLGDFRAIKAAGL